MKIVIHTLGCKVNQYESDAVANSLTKAGHEVSYELGFADLYIINTCAVTNESERKSRQMVSRLTKYNKNARVIVMGCASQNNAEQFLEKDQVSLVLGVAGKHLVSSLIDEVGNATKVLPTEYENQFQVEPNRARSTLKIQDGCNQFCSYCLIPYLRGESRSRALASIIEEAKQLSSESREIVVTGINTSDYKINGELALGRLMRALSNIPARIRISSLEVNVITKEFLTILASMPNFAPHFHLSLQSGSDAVLKAMNRNYTTKQFLNKVKLIRKFFKHAAITTDLIVGFSGESEKHHKQTIKTLKKATFFDVHVFPYSVRKGTKAEHLQQVPKEQVKARLKQVQALKKEGFKAYLSKSLNTTQTVLIEAEHEGLFYGHTEHYIKVYLAPQPDLKPNEFYEVKLISLFKDGVIGQYSKKGE
jgi:threonylcarbamoyladenosine tRNA methylthiotransferase MtaB